MEKSWGQLWLELVRAETQGKGEVQSVRREHVKEEADRGFLHACRIAEWQQQEKITLLTALFPLSVGDL